MKNLSDGESARSHCSMVINGPRPANLDCRISSGNDRCLWRLFSGCKLFNSPSPADKSATSPARGEVLTNILSKGLDAVRQYEVLFERRVQSSTRAQKFLADGVQCGRSMIEMLGVLAIIGVLSVGGIAGYSKAMEKWKINKTISAVAQITMNIKNLYAEQKNYYSLGIVSRPNRTVLDIVVPSDMLDDSVYYQVRHPLNGQLAIYTTGRNRTERENNYAAFAISIKGINKKACAEIASFDWGKNDSGFIGLVVGINMGNSTGTAFFENCDIGEKANGLNNHYACRKDLPLPKTTAIQWCDCGNTNTCEVGLKFY